MQSVWLTCVFIFLLRSQAARGKEGMKDGVSEMGTRLDPVPGLPGGERVEICVQCVNLSERDDYIPTWSCETSIS